MLVASHVSAAAAASDGSGAASVPAASSPSPLIDPALAATFGCSSLTPYRATRKALEWMPAGAKVVLIGAGGLGQFGIQYLRSMTDAHVIVADTSPGKRARALELGAHEVCDTAELEGPLDVVFDYVGADATLAVANRIIRRGGLVVNVGAYGGSIPFGFSLVPHETWWTQSMWGSRDDLAAVIRIAQRGDLQYSVERLPLEASAVPVDAPKLPRALQRHDAAHTEMLALGAKKLGAPMSEFRGFQLDVKDPPWMSMLVLAFDC